MRVHTLEDSTSSLFFLRRRRNRADSRLRASRFSRLVCSSSSAASNKSEPSPARFGQEEEAATGLADAEESSLRSPTLPRRVHTKFPKSSSPRIRFCDKNASASAGEAAWGIPAGSTPPSASGSTVVRLDDRFREPDAFGDARCWLDSECVEPTRCIPRDDPTATGGGWAERSRSASSKLMVSLLLSKVEMPRPWDDFSILALSGQSMPMSELKSGKKTILFFWFDAELKVKLRGTRTFRGCAAGTSQLLTRRRPLML